MTTERLPYLNPAVVDQVPIAVFNGLVDVINTMNDMIDAMAEELWGEAIHDVST